MNDGDFISKKFEEYDIPPDKEYLLHYFTGELQVSFLKYILAIGDKKRFREHTGFVCSDTLLERFQNRLRRLTNLHGICKKVLTEETMEIVSLLETGKIKLKDLSIYEERVKCVNKQTEN